MIGTRSSLEYALPLYNDSSFSLAEIKSNPQKFRSGYYLATRRVFYSYTSCLFSTTSTVLQLLLACQIVVQHGHLARKRAPDHTIMSQLLVLADEKKRKSERERESERKSNSSNTCLDTDLCLKKDTTLSD